MKYILFIALAFTVNVSLAQACTLTPTGAKAMAELFVLSNESEIAKWVEITPSLESLAKKIASTGEYSSERNSYYFEIVTYPNNGGSWHSGAWLEATCSGIHLDYQTVD